MSVGVVATASVLLAALLQVPSIRALPFAAPAVYTAEGCALVVALRLHSCRQFVWWAALAALTFLGVASIAETRTEGLWGGPPRAAGAWQTIETLATLGALLGVLWVGAQLFRALLNVPAASQSARIGLSGFAAVVAATEWLWLDPDTGGFVSTAIAALMVSGAVAMAYCLVLLARTLPELGRRSDLVIAIAGTVFAVGQAVMLVAHREPQLCVAHSFHITAAAGILVAAAFHPTMQWVGSPLHTHTDRPLTNRCPAVLITSFMAQSIIAALTGGGWVVTRSIIVMSIIVAILGVGIVWLCGTFLDVSRSVGRIAPWRLRVELRAGLGRGEVVAYFQPIVRAADLEVVGYETLARWHHPRRGVLTAQRFIGAAADAGFLATIDHLMIRLAAEARPTMRTTVDGAMPFVTVNVDPSRMQQPGFADRLLTELSQRQLDPAGLIFELTETAPVHDLVSFQHNVASLRRAGVGLAIDDFGVGHSNLGLLVHLDPDLVKLDRTLVEAAVMTERGQSVVRNGVEAARACGARVVAEGVADTSWDALLHLLGFDLLQGFAFGEPVPAGVLGGVGLGRMPSPSDAACTS